MHFSLAFVGDTYHAVAIIRAAGKDRILWRDEKRSMNF